MTLKDCTKEELIFVISQLQSHCGRDGTYYTVQALSDVALKREEKKLSEAGLLADRAFQKRQEYIDLLTPYDGMRWVDIPASVLEKADAVMKEAQDADCKWAEIMGLKARQQ